MTSHLNSKYPDTLRSINWNVQHIPHYNMLSEAESISLYKFYWVSTAKGYMVKRVYNYQEKSNELIPMNDTAPKSQTNYWYTKD
jgi:hypothetical protein